MVHAIGVQRANRDRIRALFLDSKNSYSLESAAALLNVPLSRLQEESVSGAIATYRFRGKVRVRWEELASYALLRWSLVAIAAALARDITLAMPPLPIPRFVTFCLPSYQLSMLHALARRQKTEPDSFLAAHLLDLASAHSQELEDEFPGFAEALNWPHGE